MTAINLFTQGSAAYLLTDGALVDFDGKLLAVENKVVALAALQLAICTTGFGVADFATDHPDGVSNGQVLAALADAGVLAAAGHREAMARLPFALRAMHQKNLAAFAHDPIVEDRSSILMAVAAYDPVDRTAKAFIGTSEALGPHPAYAFARVREYLTTPREGIRSADLLRTALGRPVNLQHQNSFDVRRDGLRLLNAQRTITGGPCGGNYHGVGGKAFMTTVSAGGAMTETLHTWQEDFVGLPIRPTTLLIAA